MWPPVLVLDELSCVQSFGGARPGHYHPLLHGCLIASRLIVLRSNTMERPEALVRLFQRSRSLRFKHPRSLYHVFFLFLVGQKVLMDEVAAASVCFYGRDSRDANDGAIESLISNIMTVMLMGI